MATVNLDALLHAAGASLGGAQDRLMTGVDAPPSVMAIAEATLDMKVTIDGAAGGALQVAPVSAADARTGAVDTAALSTVTMRFVAFGNDLPGQIAPATPAPAATDPGPVRGPAGGALTRAAAEAALRGRADIARRIAAGEPIRFTTTPLETGGDVAHWVVTAHDAAGASVAAALFNGKT